MKPYRKYIGTGMVLLMYAPYWLWEITHPLLIDATARGDKIDYEFGDAEYAKFFEEENGA
jgi:hypothetical protein